MWQLLISLVVCVLVDVSLAQDGVGDNTDTTTTTTAPPTTVPLTQILQEMDASMDAFDRLDAKVQQVIHSVDGTVQLMQDIQKQRVKVELYQASIQDTWTTWNYMQYEQLQTQMKNILDAEIQRREHAQHQVEEYIRQKEYLKTKMEQAKESSSLLSSTRTTQPGITREEMHDILSVEAFMQKRDAKVGEWISSVLEETIQERPMPRYEWADRAEALLPPTMTPSQEEGGCYTLLDATEYIQQALTNYSHDDGLGVTDHAQGGWISHQGTSPTFHIPFSGETWGTSPWRDYLIPEEVEEYILSHIPGWKSWPVWPVKFLPHSLVTTLFGSSALTTAPPETILQPATFPGACWPMQGSSGQVTIVLPYAIHPIAISIDHVSRLLTPEDKTRQAAPKTMRVWAYGTCGERNCHGQEYDESTVYDLFGGQTITYDSEGSSVQTFWIRTPDSPGENSSQDEEESNPPGCTTPEDHEMEEPTISTCSSDIPAVLSKDTLVRAIKLEVIDNWGHGEYTCIYRTRVHGSPFR
jgi:SUN domain-containing protein 1/2